MNFVTSPTISSTTQQRWQPSLTFKSLHTISPKLFNAKETLTIRSGRLQFVKLKHCRFSLPHYTALKFLGDAIDRYVNFLLLKVGFLQVINQRHRLQQTYSDQFFTPCYDFDLVWHTHQVHPLAYVSFSITIYMFNILIVVSRLHSHLRQHIKARRFG